MLLGDCRERMAELDAESVDAIVTDPPYGLSFMGKEWDHGVPGVPFWTEALRVLKPGGHLLAFGGTRTFHRLAVAIEDAGFEVRDCLSWLYGSGFPKSHNLHGEREGFGTALKPAWEPIILARKPLQGTVAANVLKFGTGAVNVDGCRIGTERGGWGGGGSALYEGGLSREGGDARPVVGRWPANVVLDECAAELLDQMSGDRKVNVGTYRKANPTAGMYGAARREGDTVGFGDSGGASRFFYCAKASRREREAGLDGLPRNVHPTVKPVSLMRWLVRLVTPPGGLVLDPFTGSGTTGVAATLEGFRFLGMEQSAEYVEIATRRIAHAEREAEPVELEDAPLFAEAGA